MSEATQYQILRSTDDQCYSDITGLGAYAPSACSNSEATTFDIAHSDVDTTQTYTDTERSYGTIYYYWIRSYSTSGYSASTTTAVTTTTAPPRVEDEVTLTATRGSTNQTNIEINWSAADEATSYALYRSTADACISDGDGNLSTTASSCAGYNRSEIFALTSTNSNLPNDTIYYYYVAGINAAGEGRLSPVNSIRTAATAPSLNYDNSLIAVDRIKYTWSQTSVYDSEYELYLYTGSSSCDPSTSACAGEVSVTANNSPSIVTGLTAGTEYHAKIVATTEYTQEDDQTSTLTGDISSSAKSEHTLPYHPQIDSHTIDNNNNVTFTLTPTAGTDDITYTIHRTTDSTCARATAAAGSCADSQTITSTSTTITDTIAKNGSTYYYYYAWSHNPAGDGLEPSGYDTSNYGVLTNPDKIDAEFSFDYSASSFDKIDITVTANEDVPSGDTLSLVYYPTYVNNPSKLTYTVGSLNNSQTHAADLTLSNTLYYLQPHTVDLVNSNSSGNGVILYTENIDKLPPPQVFPRVATSNDQLSGVAVKTVAYDIRLENSTNGTSNTSFIENIQSTFGIEASYQAFIAPTSGSCFVQHSLISSTECNEAGSLHYIRDQYAKGNFERYHDPFVTYPAFDNFYSSFTEEHDFTNLVPEVDDDTYHYRQYAILKEYQINTKNSGASYAYVSYEDDSDRVAGHYATISLHSDATTNSVSAPESLLVANPPLLAQQLSATSSDPNSWDLSLLWSALSGISAYDIYEYSNPDCAYLLSEPSLCANFSLYSSNIPEFTRAFSGADSGNYFYYRLQAHDSVGNSSALGEQIAVYPPQPLNDSGIASCIESELISGRQDCQVGRDAELEASAKVGSGSAGFDFNVTTDESGQLCVQDNVTGLIWSAWSPNSGSDSALTGLDTNTSAVSFAELAVISLEACGHSDWRLPSLHELLSIADYNQSAAKLDTSIFAEFNSSLPTYWSASGHVLDFSSGEFGFESSASARHSVFLTRGARSWGSDFGAERFQLVEELDDNNLSIYLVFDMHSQLRYAPCLAGMSYDPLTHSCSGAATALDYIDSLNAYDANSSWRQPNIKELVAILDPSNSLQPNPEFFPAYPAGAQIFSLTPSAQSAAAITGRLFDVETQSSQPAIFEFLNSHLIYGN